MKPIVFDFGGVLVGWNPVRLLRRAVPELAPDDASAQALALDFFQSYGGDWGDYDRGTVEPADVVQRIARRTGLPASAVQRVVDDVPRELAPIDDSVAWLRQLHASGRPLYYLSNMSLPMSAHLEATHSFMQCFRDGVFSGRVGLIKPEPAIFALAAERFGHPGSALMFLDDHAPNIEAARAAGWHALLFTSAAQAQADLRAAGWID